MSIRMGNDEFILYIRKQHPNCKITNEILGKRIWQWLRDKLNSQASKDQEDVPCFWGAEGNFIREDKLPKTAAQFSFEPAVLPDLYAFLDDLGSHRE